MTPVPGVRFVGSSAKKRRARNESTGVRGESEKVIWKLLALGPLVIFPLAVRHAIPNFALLPTNPTPDAWNRLVLMLITLLHCPAGNRWWEDHITGFSMYLLLFCRSWTFVNYDIPPKKEKRNQTMASIYPELFRFTRMAGIARGSHFLLKTARSISTK